MRRRQIKHTIPEPKDQQANRKRRGSCGGRPTGFDKAIYKRRNEIERTINALRHFRAVATRFEKRASVFYGAVTVARSDSGFAHDPRCGHRKRIPAACPAPLPAHAPPGSTLIPSASLARQNVATNLGDLRSPGRAREPEYMAEGVSRAISRLDHAINACLTAVSDQGAEGDLLGLR